MIDLRFGVLRLFVNPVLEQLYLKVTDKQSTQGGRDAKYKEEGNILQFRRSLLDDVVH